MSDYVPFGAQDLSLDPECLELGLQFNERVEENDGPMPEGHEDQFATLQSYPRRSSVVALASYWTPIPSGLDFAGIQSGPASVAQGLQFHDSPTSCGMRVLPQCMSGSSSASEQRSSRDLVDLCTGDDFLRTATDGTNGHPAASSTWYAVDYSKLPLHGTFQRLSYVEEFANHACQIPEASTNFADTNDMQGDYEASPATTVTNKKDGFRCDVPGCNSGVFKRKSDLRRHQLKHQGARVYACPVKSCGYRGSRAFYRGDKLQSHIRSGHSQITIATCPVDGCGMERPLLILAKHLLLHEYRVTSEASYAIEEGMRSQTCPLNSCNATVHPGWFQEHLGKHDISQRLRNSAAIESIGYGADPLSMLCPFCETSSPNVVEWIEHVIRYHIVKDQFALSQLDESSIQVIPHRLWKSCEPSRYSDSGSCHYCQSRFADRHAVDRHNQEKFAALQPKDLIYPKRLEILRMWPGFFSHPVFDGDRPTVNAYRY